jgi:hypothetical protein
VVVTSEYWKRKSGLDVMSGRERRFDDLVEKLGKLQDKAAGLLFSPIGRLIGFSACAFPSQKESAVSGLMVA